jgi:glutathione synthase/RimK-type ligase-like ATP-grasp enzyme
VIYLVNERDLSLHLKIYMEDNGIEYCNASYMWIVNNINNVDKLNDCIVWIWFSDDLGDYKYAFKTLSCLDSLGYKVFPSPKDYIHYDDKFLQLLLTNELDGDISTPKSKLVSRDEIPLINGKFVLKTSNGAGSSNVYLLESGFDKLRFKYRAKFFGIPFIDRFNILVNKSSDLFLHGAFLKFLKNIYRSFFPTAIERYVKSEKDLFLQQSFLENEGYDLRVIIINNKAIAIKRYALKNDFRASGSGVIVHDPQLDENLLERAFMIHKKLGFFMQAYDFVISDDEAFLIEMSYNFSREAYFKCSVHWDSNLVRHIGGVCIEKEIIDRVL